MGHGLWCIVEAVGINRKPGFALIWWCTGFCLVIMLKEQMLTGDSDLMVHICYGREILDKGLFAPDPLLYEVPAAPIQHEWLFQVAMAELEKAAGASGLLLMAAVLVGTLWWLLFSRMRQKKVGTLYAMAYSTVLIVAFKPHLVLRPHLFSWLAAPFLYALLEDGYDGKRSTTKTAIYVSLTMLLWANVHGGFVLGIGLIVMFVLLEPIVRRQLKRLFQLGVISGAALGATLINPWGIRLHGHIVSFLTNDIIVRSTSDFRPPSLSDNTATALCVLAVLTWCPLIVRYRYVHLREWLMAAALLGAALMSVRNIPYMGILMLPIAARYKACFFESRRTRFSKRLNEISERWDAADSGGWGYAVLLLAVYIVLSSTGVVNVSFRGKTIPVVALKWMTENVAVEKEAVFADFGFAGYLLYLTPVQKVYLHSLNASVPEARLLTWLSIGRDESGWDKKISDYNWAFLRTGTPQSDAFLRSPSWRQMHRDEMGVIFRREDGEPDCAGLE